MSSKPAQPTASLSLETRMFFETRRAVARRRILYLSPFLLVAAALVIACMVQMFRGAYGEGVIYLCCGVVLMTATALGVFDTLYARDPLYQWTARYLLNHRYNNAQLSRLRELADLRKPADNPVDGYVSMGVLIAEVQQERPLDNEAA